MSYLKLLICYRPVTMAMTYGSYQVRADEFMTTAGRPYCTPCEIGNHEECTDMYWMFLCLWSFFWPSDGRSTCCCQPPGTNNPVGGVVTATQPEEIYPTSHQPYPWQK